MLPRYLKRVKSRLLTFTYVKFITPVLLEHNTTMCSTQRPSLFCILLYPLTLLHFIQGLARTAYSGWLPLQAEVTWKNYWLFVIIYENSQVSTFLILHSTRRIILEFTKCLCLSSRFLNLFSRFSKTTPFTQ